MTVLIVPSNIAFSICSKATRWTVCPVSLSSNQVTLDGEIPWARSHRVISAFWLSVFCRRDETRQ